ncbi:MAG: Antitoxin component of bacterial toxin-antitoxin system, MqsA [Acidimicrobiia bacterium]|jgi:hypothetical protein|nr:Antitoxin component of bacterial toxin-antitoxin system, MqsA [Acidimicrobiia bacterium]
MKYTPIPVEMLCPTCDSITVLTDEITLMVNPYSGTSTYALICPSCDEVVCGPAEADRIFRALRALVEVHRFEVVPEMLETHSGPPISSDDVLDFHQAIHGIS